MNDVYEIEIQDETIAEFDETLVTEQLETVRSLFSKLANVRESHPEVQQLLLYAGHGSWPEFCEQFKEEVTALFAEEEPSTEPVEREAISPFVSRYRNIQEGILENLNKQLAAAQERTTALTEQMKKMGAAKEAAEEFITLNEHAWESETLKAVTKSKAQLAALTKQLPLIQKNLAVAKKTSAQLVRNLEFAEYKHRVCDGKARLIINSGDAISDAQYASAVQQKAAWQISSIENSILLIQFRQLQRVNRQTPLDSSMAGYSSAGVIEGTDKKLDDLRTSKARHFEMAAAAEVAYEEALSMCDPDATYLPDLQNLFVQINKATLNSAEYAKKRQAEQQAALQAAREGGFE